MKINYYPILQYIFFILLILHYSHAKSYPYHPRYRYLINCGGASENEWVSDSSPPFAPLQATTNTTLTATSPPPYDSTRVFWGPLTYTIPIPSPGPILLRLYFAITTSYNNINPTQFSISLDANGFNLLRNFTPANENSNGLGSIVREFYVTIGDGFKGLNLSFTNGNGLVSSTYGFVNGIEIISVPEGLYVNYQQNIPYLEGGSNDYANPGFIFKEAMAMEMVMRVNVGGAAINPSDDSGLYRTWLTDMNSRYMEGPYFGMTPYFGNTSSSTTTIQYTNSTPAYTAPDLVYQTERIVGPTYKQERHVENLTWVFDVDASFNYLVRLHFCELAFEVNKTSEDQFSIYINSQMAEPFFDGFDNTGGRGIPVYKDFVTYMDSNTTGSKVNMRIRLQPILRSSLVDAFLNGLEIFKLNNLNGSLGVPSFKVSEAENTPTQNSRHRRLVPIVIGAALGFTLLSLVAVVSLVMYRAKDKKAVVPATKMDSSKQDWTPLNIDEYESRSSTATGTTSTSAPSSLPSDICRRFSIAQIRVATGDFDESAIIGVGGFGKVYKGSIDSGPATLVAVKRLNPTSTQGAHEFRTEIEMLTMLRHIHLVSLIGYCNDDGEMILVYEYMPRGTLRDHLMYKISNNGANNTTQLSWKQRLAICIGSAKGLHYLHMGAKHPIIHRDVKSTNILLDDKWVAKVSDFGLSKLGPAAGGVGHISTVVKGSLGYLDPEYFQTNQLTQKSDLFSFGVVLFEVLCARKAMNPTLPKEQVNLAYWARDHCKRGTLDSIVDPNLAGQIAPESLRKFGEMAEMCVRDHGSERPSMEDLVWGLEFALQLQLTADNQKNHSSVVDHGVDTDMADYLTSEDSFSISRSTFKSFSSVIDDQTTRSASVFSEIMHPQGR